MGRFVNPPRRARRIGRPSWRDGRGQEALPESREELGGEGDDGRPFQRAGRGQQALPEGWKGREALPVVKEGSGGHPEGPVGVGRQSRRDGRGGEEWEESGGLLGEMERVGRSFQRAGRSWGSLPECWEGWEGPPGGWGSVKRHFQRDRRCREAPHRAGKGRVALSKVREWSGGSLGGLPGEIERVRRSFRRAGRSWGSLPECWEVLGGPAGGTGGVETDGRSREFIQDGREDLEAFLEGREWSRGSLGGPRGFGSHPRRVKRFMRPTSRAGWGQEALPEVQQGSRSSPGEPRIVGNPSRRAGRCQEVLLEGREG